MNYREQFEKESGINPFDCFPDDYWRRYSKWLESLCNSQQNENRHLRKEAYKLAEKNIALEHSIADAPIGYYKKMDGYLMECASDYKDAVKFALVEIKENK